MSKLTDKLDYKHIDKELYAPTVTPALVEVPPLLFIQVDGRGDPNLPEGEYQRALELLYALTYTIKMLPKNGVVPPDYFAYVVPPLEGLWWMEGLNGVDLSDKSKFCWTSMIRQPDFVTNDVFDCAAVQVKKKKPLLDITKARLTVFNEGLCVQCMHIGSYDEEAATVAKMRDYMADHGLVCDLSESRRHHEIYLGDPRKTAVAKLKTVVRHPVRRS